jgi:O-antigen/teichoic acid export membrane protein
LLSKALRILAQDGRKSFWAFSDQAIVSLGNFAVNVLVYRHLSLAEAGAFTLLFDIMLFVNGVQSALVNYPLTVQAATTSRAAVGRLASMGLFVTTLGLPLLGVVIGGVCLVNGGPTINPGVILAAIGAVFAWQVQETTRRAMMGKLRFRGAVIGDAVSYLGQAGGVFAFGMCGCLTLTAVYEIMAVTSLAALVIQATQLPLHWFSRAEMKAAIKEWWRLGRWQLSGNVAAVGASAAYTCNIRFWVGDQLLAVHGAINNLFRLTNLLSAAATTLIVPHAARANADGGLRRAIKAMFRFGSIAGLPLVIYLGFLFFFPSTSLDLFYGRHNAFHQYRLPGAATTSSGALLVRIIALNVGLIFVSTVAAALLNGVGRSHRFFIGQVGYALGFLVIGVPLTASMKLIGAALGGLVGALAQTVLNADGVWRAWKDGKTGQQSDFQGAPQSVEVVSGASGPMEIAATPVTPIAGK